MSNSRGRAIVHAFASRRDHHGQCERHENDRAADQERHQRYREGHIATRTFSELREKRCAGRSSQKKHGDGMLALEWNDHRQQPRQPGAKTKFKSRANSTNRTEESGAARPPSVRLNPAPNMLLSKKTTTESF
jgi:hypothetical protein